MAGNAIGEILPLAVGVAISPVPIIAIVLMLGTPSARSNGPAFAFGWLLGLTAVGVIVLALAGDSASSDAGEPATWASVLKLALGALFLLISGRQWRGRPKAGEEPSMPKWMRAVDTFTAGKSFGFGAVLSGVNPKNLALAIAAGLTIAQADLSGGQEAVALAIFVLVGSMTILTPAVIYFAMGARAAELLDAMKEWMAAHNAAIMTVLLLVLGAKLIGDAVAGLSA